MDSLPLEILQHIFNLACVDGGFTGCSLSRTSRAIRSASRTTRFHSVSLLAEPNHLRAFLSLYANQAQHVHGDRARVKHVHLTFPLEPESASCDERSQCTISGVHALLHAVANDLHTLLLHVENLRSTGNPLPILVAPLPSLRELTTVGIADPRALVDDTLSPTPLFPATTRVHCVLSGPKGMPFNPSLAPWTMHAPRATHIRLTNVPSMAYLLAGELLAAADVTSTTAARSALGSVDRGNDADVARLCTHLRYIVLQPVAGYSGCGYVAKMLAACSSSKDGAPRIVFVEPSEDIKLDAAAEWSRSTTTTITEWTRRIEGGEGCWGCVQDCERDQELTVDCSVDIWDSPTLVDCTVR